MTARDGFDLLVSSWLEGAGPGDADPAIVERALATAARTRRRRGVVAAIGGEAPWPRTRSTFSGLPVIVRVAILVAVAAAAIAGAVFVGSQRRGPQPADGPIGTVTTVGAPTVARNGPVLVRLADGRVAVAGGVELDAGPLEIFDPATGSFAPRPGLDLRGGGSGFLLPSGNVLLVMYDGNIGHAYAAVVDAQTGAVVALPSTATDHLNSPAASQLLDGRMLFCGGAASKHDSRPFNLPLAAAEIFDPLNNRFTRTGAMHETRWGHSAATLPDGRVLVSGGDGRADAEIFDPVTGTFGEPIPMAGVRAETISVALPNGTVAVFRGGLTTLNPDRPATATPVDIFDPASNTFRRAEPVPFEPDAATGLPDGRVFLSTASGGFVYDPTTGSNRPTGVALGSSVAAPLADGSVLVIGWNGTDEFGRPARPAAEVFRP